MFESSLSKSFKGLILRLLDIRKGESRRLVLMQTTIFLLIATLLIIKPTINALFLSGVGIDKLPFAFILVALAAGVITTFYSKKINRVPLNKVIQFTLITSVVSITIFSVLLRLNLIDNWILYVFYVWVAVFGVLSASQFWILANIVFNAREAKRLFGLIGGAAIGGGIFGGYLTSVLAPVIGSENLLFVGVSFLIICIPLTRKVWNINKNVTSSHFLRKSRTGKVSEHPLRLIKSSKHLTYLAIITALSVLAAKLVDYQFSAISSQKITNEDELAAFFGFWFSNFNLFSLLIQLFITRKVVGIYGVGISLFFLPVGILIGALAILILPGLWPAILIKAADGSLKQSVNKSAIELLAFPIPVDIKNQAKTFIDVFIDSFATGISGLLLIFLVNGLNMPVRFVSILIILLLAIWLKYIRKVRLEYIEQFKRKLNLDSNKEKNKEYILDIQNSSVYEGLTKVLYYGNDKQILYILKNVDDLQHEKLFPAIKHLLKHESPEIITEAIKKLYFYKSENLSEEIKKFLKHEVKSIRVAATEYLIEHSGNKIELIQQYLEQKDESLVRAAILALASETKDNQELKINSGLLDWIKNHIEKIKTITAPEKNETIDTVLNVIGLSMSSEFYNYISEALKNEDSNVRESAVLAAGLTLAPTFLPDLLTNITDTSNKQKTIDALSGYGFKIFDYLQEQIEEGNLNIQIIRQLPSVSEKIGTQNGVDFLFRLLDIDDNIVRNNAVLALTKLKSKHPHLIFYNKRIIENILEEAKLFMNTLSAMYIQQEKIHEFEESSKGPVFEAHKGLIVLLERRLDENLTRIFKFLGLKYPPEEIDTIYREIKNPKAEMRINAIEFLDNLLDTHLKKLVMPIVETSLSESVTKELLDNMDIKVLPQEECLTSLLEGKDVKIKLSVLYLIGVLKDRKYITLAKKYINHPNEKIRLFASNAVQDIMKNTSIF